MTTTAFEPSTTAPRLDSGADVLDNLRALLPDLRAGAAANEQARRLSDDTVAALRRAGAFRIAAPARFGGLETNLRTMLDVSSTIAEGDGGASWVTTLSNINHWALGLFDERAQAEVYADGPDVVISGGSHRPPRPAASRAVTESAASGPTPRPASTRRGAPAEWWSSTRTIPCSTRAWR